MPYFLFEMSPFYNTALRVWEGKREINVVSSNAALIRKFIQKKRISNFLGFDRVKCQFYYFSNSQH